MSDAESNEEDSSTLSARVNDWMSKQGYPLEMFTSRAFRKAGFNTYESSYYIDPDTNEPREYDLCAIKERHVSNGDVVLRVSLCVECKYAGGERGKHPWTILTTTSQQISLAEFLRQRAASTLGHTILEQIADREGLPAFPLYKFHKRAGYTVTQAFNTGADVTYKAIMGAAKASRAQAQTADRASKTPRGPYVAEMVFPMVVIGGRLFITWLGDDNALNTDEIPYGLLVSRNPIVGKTHSILHIVTRANLDAFASLASETADQLLDLAEAEISQLKKDPRSICLSDW